MRISLVTRVFVGFLTVFVLLGGVVVYAVVTMSQMQSEVTLVKQGLVPISAKLSALYQDLTQVSALLDKKGCEETLWVTRKLPEFRPFATLQEVATSAEELAQEEYLSPRSRELFTAVASGVTGLIRGDDLARRLAGDLVAEGIEIDVRSNRVFYQKLIEQFLFISAATPVDFAATRRDLVRHSLAAATAGLARLVREYEATANLAINSAWENAREREAQAVTYAFYLGILALFVTVLVLVLLVVWLKPLRTLRAVAQRISTGDYDRPAPIRRGDEIGALSDELNKMAGRLKEREEMIRKQADELLRADRFSTIGKMSTQIAHEIRNPLNALGLKLELLEESVQEARQTLPPEIFETLLTAAQAGGKEIDRLREITEYYLKFAKFPEVEKESVDLHTVLTDVISFYREEALGKGVELVGDIERPLRSRADPNLLRHAVANLLKNAIEATTSSNETVTGAVEVVAQRDGGRIRIAVRDNGPGMTTEHSRRVFEPFYSTKRSGTGLGLTLVQQVVAEHGGSIQCISAPGEGTTFKLSIPE
jgi:two-component system NtrC family sensor kinase